MSSKELSKFVPTQRFTGMQVVDIRGIIVGKVKDVSVDFQNKTLAFRVTTRNNAEIDMGWDDILSVEDVVLLKKNIDLEKSGTPTIPSPSIPVGLAQVICPNCGASSPAQAKFCPKCGTNITK